jgi:hypothetical protein
MDIQEHEARPLGSGDLYCLFVHHHGGRVAMATRGKRLSAKG